MLKIRKEWCDLKGFNFIDFESLKEAEEYILFLEAKIEALHQPAVVSQRELLLDFAEYSENDKTSTAIDECVDNYLDSIKQ